MAKKSSKQKALERRRLRAGRLLLKGYSQAEVARRVGVGAPSVSAWAKRLAEGGLEALKSTRALGRRPGLDETQRARLAKALKAGALHHGFATELWTLPRVARLIESQFGLRYSEVHVWRILRSMGWTPQRPSNRALERDEAAIEKWKRKRWPTLKKTLPDKDGSSSSSTSRD